MSTTSPVEQPRGLPRAVDGPGEGAKPVPMSDCAIRTEALREASEALGAGVSHAPALIPHIQELRTEMTTNGNMRRGPKGGYPYNQKYFPLQRLRKKGDKCIIMTDPNDPRSAERARAGAWMRGRRNGFKVKTHLFESGRMLVTRGNNIAARAE